MRMKIKQWMKRSLAGLTALAMVFGNISVLGISAQAQEMETVSVSDFTSHFSGEVVLENTGGDNLVLLQPLSSKDTFVFGADVTFTNLDEQQSAALVFGVRNNDVNDSMKANIHNRIDWNVPARVWGYGTDELRCPGESGQANTFFADNKIDVTQKFRMEVSVEKNSENEYELTYSLTNTDGEKITTAQGILNDSYTGGRFGLMTYSSRAVFSNITVDGQKYGALESADGTLTLHGVNGDAHAVSDVKMESGQAFTYETDVDLAADTCSAALTFGIQNPESPADAWIGANFNFNDNDGAGGARVFKVQNGATDIGSAVLNGVLDRSKTIHLKLQVSDTGLVTFELYNTDNEANKVTVSGTLNDYQGGYLGLLTFDSSATFSNTAYTVEAEVTEPEESEPGEDDDGIPDSFGATIENGIYVLDNCYGYVFEIDDVNGTIDGEDTTLITTASAYESSNPNWAISVQLRPNGNDREYSVMKVVECPGSASAADITLKDGDVILVTHSAASCPGDYENWLSKVAAVALKEGDVIEIASDNSTATVIGPGEVLPDESLYNTNLGELTYAGGSGSWTFTENGLYSDATGMGDCFAFSQVKGTNFVYSTDIDFDGTEGAAALVFRSNQDLDSHESYAVNIDVGSHTCKFWRWQKGEALQLMDVKAFPATTDETYNLKVVAYDSWILYYVNDQLMASTGDYVLQPGNLGQNTVIKEGCFGILNWNSKVTFQNTYYKELSGDFNPILTDISVTSSVGTVEEKTQFTPTEPITLQYVKNDASTVNINTTRASSAAVVEVTDAYGNVYADGRNIPVEEGSNYITVTSTVTAEDGMTATATYRVNVHRFQEDAVYYNEAYRDQYHYSVKEGWANDPNGLVYYNGTYHMFYQFYDDIRWGPMHWAHATSTDLIHWEEQPIALYPDANGAMFSGCMVVDTENTSGFFDGIQGGGLVALITADGNGQRIKLAYSTDEGKTWTKVDEIAADWTDDPLKDAAFRDPKVFRWEGKWFMVVAGGPLRIYSSDDLRSWKCEATYADLHTECPDMYPIEAPDGQIKWVLSRGGRYYKIGDFKTVDGSWRFVPDADYENSDGVMNFGRDFYAAMTYYVQDFGTAADPTLPELIELNWMNTWDDYCNQVAEETGKAYNGTFNLNLKLGLKKDGEKYLLTQTPIDGYETLRQTAEKQEWTQVTVEQNNTLLKDFVGDTYEIIAKFYPEEGTTKVGFKVRTGEDEQTLVIYDLESQMLSIDRSSSGVIISSKFAEVTSQYVAKNADGTVDLHVYVDKGSMEVFAQDYTAAGSVQIFPSPLSVGAEVLVEGDAAKADITIYPLGSIWTDKVELTEPQYIGTTASTSQKLYVGETVKLNAYLLPTTVSQEFTWSVVEGTDVAAVDASGTVTGLKVGTAVIKAASKAAPELTIEFEVQVTENNFNTNITEFVNMGGNWFVDDETLSVSNGGQNDYYMSAETFEGNYVLETDICYTRGLVNLFLASEGLNPHVGVGAYTIQFGYDANVRLFPFGNNDFAVGTMSGSINDGEYHHVKVIRDGQKIVVYVDDEKCLEHTFTQTEAFFAKGHVGLGLWDGELDVQNFHVSALVDEVSLKLEEVTSEEKAELDALLEGDYQETFEGFDRAMTSVKLIAERYDGSTYEIYDEVRSFVLPYPESIDESNLGNYEFVMLCVKQGTDAQTTELVSFEVTEEGIALNSVPGIFVMGYKDTTAVPPAEITRQPADVEVKRGETATVSIEATGEGLTYAWYCAEAGETDFVLNTEFTGAEYTLAMTLENSGHQVYCIVTDAEGNSVKSDTVTLTVEPAQLQILTQPVDVSADHGQKAVVTLVAEGDGLTYTWYYKNSGAAGFSKTDTFTGPSYSLVMNETRDGRQIYCLVQDQYGNQVQSDIVTLTMNKTPLAIVTQPESVEVKAGQTAEVSVEATGDGLTYAWYYRNSGAASFSKTDTFTGPTYSLTMNEARDGRQVYCVIMDQYGDQIQSDIVTLTMDKTPLAIVTQPVSVEVKAGETAEVTVEATGDGLTYTWYYKNSGAVSFSKTDAFTGPTYALSMNEARDGRQVYCVIMDQYGDTVQSDIVTLTMYKTPLVIVQQPVSVSVAEGETAEVSVEATGEDLTYEWYYKNAAASTFTKTDTFTGPTYSLVMNEARDGRQIYCKITDKYGNSVCTDTVTLSMEVEEIIPLEIVSQPESITLASGDSGEITVEAVGDGLTYEWYYKNAGSSKFTKTSTFTGPTYSLTMSASRSGRHVYCVITDQYGESVQTEIVTLNMVSELELLSQPEDVSAASGEKAVVTVDAVGEELSYTWYYRNAGASTFSTTSSFTGDTYSVEMNSSRDGREVYCVITDTNGNTVATDIVVLTMA